MTLEWGHFSGNFKELAKKETEELTYFCIFISQFLDFYFLWWNIYSDVEEIKSWISQYPSNPPPPFANRGTARSCKEGPWSFIQMQTNLSMRIYHSLTFFF